MAQRRFSAISPPASAEYIESQSCKKNVGLYYVPLRRPGNLRCNMQHRHGKTAENHLLAESYENAVIGRTKQFFCQPVLTNRPNDFPKRPACLCQFSRVHPKGSVPRSRGSAGDCFSLIADTIPPAAHRQQIVFGYCACHIAPCCHVFLF